MISEKQLLQWFCGWLSQSGSTLELNAMGAKMIYTIEPDNIETILSSNFAGRKYNLSFCADGTRGINQVSCLLIN